MSLAKVRVKDGCLHGPADGKVLHVQEFEQTPGVVWYWVVVPKIHPSCGYWYRDDCLDVVNGKLPKLPDKTETSPHRIEKDGNVAFFAIDKATKDSLIKEGYTVTYKP